MMEFFLWFTKFENTKPLALLIFFTLFCGILFYVYGSRKRSERLESYKNIPLEDDGVVSASEIESKGETGSKGN